MSPGPSGEPAVLARGLVKRFGGARALDGLDLEVAPGEVHGFLGPNGAGKSTTIRALLGLLRLEGGAARVLGRDPWADAVEVHRRLAYVPGEVALWPRLSGGQVIDLLLRARGLDPASTRRDELVERFALDPTKRCRAYSKGNRQKVVLVAALAAPVDLLVLDEPTSGLDPLMAEAFAATVREHAAAGTAVLLSSHVLGEVDHLADRVTLIREGRTVVSGRLADLRHLRRSRISAEVPPGRGDALADELARTHGVHDLRFDGTAVGLTADPEHLTAVLAVLATAGVRSLTSAPPSLEELFLDAYRTGTSPEPVP